MEFIVLFPFWLFSNFIQKRKQFLNNLISGEYTFIFQVLLITFCV